MLLQVLGLVQFFQLCLVPKHYISYEARWLTVWWAAALAQPEAGVVILLKNHGTQKWNFLVIDKRRFCMKKSRYSDSQILAILKQAEAGTPVPTLCREHGMSSATFYKWRAKYGGMDASLMKRMKELEDENRRLKKMYAEERLKAEIVQEALTKKW